MLSRQPNAGLKQALYLSYIVSSMLRPISVLQHIVVPSFTCGSMAWQALEERLPAVDALPAAEVDALETAVIKGAARRAPKDSGVAAGMSSKTTIDQCLVQVIEHAALYF